MLIAMFIQVCSNIWAYVCVCVHVQMHEFVCAWMHTQYTQNIILYFLKKKIVLTSIDIAL